MRLKSIFNLESISSVAIGVRKADNRYVIAATSWNNPNPYTIGSFDTIDEALDEFHMIVSLLETG